MVDDRLTEFELEGRERERERGGKFGGVDNESNLKSGRGFDTLINVMERRSWVPRDAKQCGPC